MKDKGYCDMRFHDKDGKVIGGAGSLVPSDTKEIVFYITNPKEVRIAKKQHQRKVLRYKV